jgi:hypothetical protein
MATDVSNGIGQALDTAGDVDATGAKYLIAPVVTNGSNSEYALTCKVWNTGGSTVYAAVNQELADFVLANAVPIPADGDFWFVGTRKPIKSLILMCDTGETSTAHFGAF